MLSPSARLVANAIVTGPHLVVPGHNLDI